MLKSLALLARRDGMSGAEFDRHLRTVHAPLVAQLPGLRRLVIHRILPDPSGSAPEWDAVAEDWFDGPEALQAALASEASRAIAADAPTFLDLGRFRLLVVESEDVPLPAASPGPSGERTRQVLPV